MIAETSSQMMVVWHIVWILVVIGWIIFPVYMLLGPKRMPGYKKVLLGIVFGLEGGAIGFLLTIGLIVVLADWESGLWKQGWLFLTGGVVFFGLAFWLWWKRFSEPKITSLKLKPGMDIDKFLERYGRTRKKDGKPVLQIELVEEKAAAGIERIRELGARGDRPGAEQVLEELRKSGDMAGLQALLIQDRDKQGDDLVDRNKEIAAVAYMRGDNEAAIQAFEEILTLKPDDVFALGYRGHIHEYRGEQTQAQGCYERMLELGEKTHTQEWEAAAYGDIGGMYQGRGEMAEAETKFQKELTLSEKLGWLEGMASSYSNLMYIFYVKKELAGAKKMLGRWLETEKRLGRLEGIASAYWYRAEMYRRWDYLSRAEKIFCKALKTNHKLGLLGGVVQACSYLGEIYRKRGYPAEAEKMHRHALEINQKLGRLQGVATQYGHLGVIYQIEGNLDEAEKMHQKSLELYEKLERPMDIAGQYGFLGVVYQIKKDLAEADTMFRKALEIYTKLGLPVKMAYTYWILGVICQTKEDLEGARKWWQKALSLFKQKGMSREIKMVRDLLDELDKKEIAAT